MTRLFLVLALVTTSLAADVVVLPKDDSTQRALEELIRRQHERDMQRRQHEYDMELERLRIEAEQASTAGAVVAKVAVPQLQAQVEAPRVVLSLDRTDLLLNGRAWLTWPAEFKGMYIMGIYEGAGAVEAGSALIETLRTRANYDEILLGIDAMYADPTNRVIPIGRILPIYTAKTRGTPTTEIDAMTAAALRAINATHTTVVPTHVQIQ